MKKILLVLTLLCAAGLSPMVRAEPYFAVQTGLKCAACHVNPTGGGMRTAFGDLWGQTVLPAKPLSSGDAAPWTGEVSRYFAVGGNLRVDATSTHIPHQANASISGFDLEQLRLYLDIRVIPEQLSIYIDQHLAPGASTNAESYVRWWSNDHHYFIKAGQMYLAYGLRLQDDTAFIRQVPGINFATPDRGVEFGMESGYWTTQLDISNGTAGGPEADSGKQWGIRSERVTGLWRAGASFNFNDAHAGKRQMQNVFAGVRTGPIAWLGQVDYIREDAFVPQRQQWVGLLEANWRVRQGQNLKLTVESFDPDAQVKQDQQARYSLVWEYTPMAFAQLRLGIRQYDGIPQNDLQNRRIIFLQLNGYF